MCDADIVSDKQAFVLRADIRAKLLRAIPRAIELLDQEARGGRVFDGDLRLRACVALVRLGPALLRLAQLEPEPPASLFHPSLSPETAARLYAEMCAESARRWTIRMGRGTRIRMSTMTTNRRST